LIAKKVKRFINMLYIYMYKRHEDWERIGGLDGYTLYISKVFMVMLHLVSIKVWEKSCVAVFENV